MNMGVGERRDKQLRHIAIEDVLEKRRLDQAMTAKEFAVLAGICYSTALDWFRSPGFPLFRGRVFWSEFAAWRGRQVNQYVLPRVHSAQDEGRGPIQAGHLRLPPQAAQILIDA